MEKITILLSLLCIFSETSGVYSTQTRCKLGNSLVHSQMRPVSEASTSSETTSQNTTSVLRKKIRNFAQNRRSNVYNAKQIEAALLECIPSSSHSKNGSAKDSISLWTLARWASELGLNIRFNDQKSKATKEKILKTFDQDIEWKNIHKIIGKKRNAAVNTLGKLQDKGIIHVRLNEEKKNKLLQDFREKLITHKGLARKYKIRESEVYCVIHEARKNKKDLSLIKMKWDIIYKNRQALSEKQKRKIVKDYNKGLLTLQGICVKHGISQKVAQSVIYENNDGIIKRRNGKQRKRDPELVLDVRDKSSQEIERKYGYTSVYIDELKRYVNQWNLLTDDQKNMYSYIVLRGKMPSKKLLDSIEKSPKRNLNEKFVRVSFASISSLDDTIEEFNVNRKNASRFKRQSDFWRILSAEEQKQKFLLRFEKDNK